MGQVVSAWQVQVTGAAVRVQRRNFVRVTLVTTLVVTLGDPEGADGPVGSDGTDGTDGTDGLDPVEGQDALDGQVTVEGTTVDVSEGGLRSVLARELAAETPVQVSFSFGEDHFELEARVVRAFPHPERPGYQGESRWDTALRFVSPDLAADALRKCIFAEQMRIRREFGR